MEAVVAGSIAMNASMLVLLHPFYGLLLLLIIVVLLIQRKCWYFVWQLNGWRGLIQQPILWILLMCSIDPKSIMSSIQRFRKYFQFPLAIIVFNRILLYVDDPVTMEGILTAPECLNKTSLQNGFFANKGLLHAKDEKWKIRRKQLNPAFSHNTLISFLDDFNRVGQELVAKLKLDLQENTLEFHQLEDIVSRAVLEASCLTTMGVSTHFTRNDEKGIAKAYRHLMELTALRILKPWYQIDFLFRLLDKRTYEKTQKANKFVQEFVANIVQQKQIEWQQRRQKQQQQLKQQQQHLQHNKGVNAIETTTATASAMATTVSPRAEPQGQQQQLLLPFSTNIGHGVEQSGNHKIATIGNDALHNVTIAEHRIFIDQIFHLAQTGKLTLQDVMDESQSMVVVSFETVSTCVINALLCLAINHDCQVKLRQEIKRILSEETDTTIRCRYGNNGDDADNSTGASAAGFIGAAHLQQDTNEGNDNDNNDVDVTVNVNMSHLQRLTYLDMIINESLRLLTTVPVNLRNVSAEFQLNVFARQDASTAASLHNRHTSDDQNEHNIKNDDDNDNSNSRRRHDCCSGSRVVKVPKNTMIALDTFNMQRNKDYWGSNALTFYPEHFAKERQSEQATSGATRHPYAFIPFSKGLRTCIGYRYSIYLSKIILCKLISSFDFTTNVQLNDLQYSEGVSLKYRNSKDIYFEIHQVSAME